MEEWKEYKLREIGRIVGGATPPTKDSANYDGDISWITPKDLSNFTGRYIQKGERSITQKGFESSSCQILPKGSILFSSRAPIGYIAIAANELCTNQGFKSIIPDNNLVNNLFLYYLLKYNKEEIEGLGSGTTFKEVSAKVMQNFDIKIPSIQTQKKIADILSSLDDKIELNRRINDNLEQQAQALFKSWFVDFEPFKDGKLVDSELGMIPEGWRVGNLLDIAKLYDAKRKPLSSRERENMKKIYPYYGATSIMDYVDKYIFDGTYLLMGEDGSVMDDKGYPYLQYVFGKFWSNNHAHVMQGKNNFSTEMLHCLLLKKNISPIVTGAVQAKISQANMRKILITQPPHEITIIFSSHIKPIYEIRKKNELENQRLSILRDTLLPKLMSGKLKINDINN